ncbi:DUF6265 family protein [Candidatus Bipolaricaulota bacterium]
MTSLPTTPLPADSLEQLNWMSGAWLEDTPLRRCEEIWSTVDAHTLMGMFRWISDDDVSFYEFMVIKVTDAGVELHVKHFHPSLVAWEEKDRFQAFVLTDLQAHRAVYAAVQNPEESEVTGGWLTYELTDGNHLEVCLIESNEEVKLNFHFVRET